MPEALDNITIVPFDDRYVQHFTRLNRDWLEKYDLIEAADAFHLDTPYESIIAPGGEIFFALDNDRVVGTCAAIPHAQNHVEIAKLAVDPDARGQGIGRRLTEAVVAYARQIHAQTLFLVSNTRLKTALKLYESLGFAYAPLPAETDYATADVYMELHVSHGSPGQLCGEWSERPSEAKPVRGNPSVGRPKNR